MGTNKKHQKNKKKKGGKKRTGTCFLGGVHKCTPRGQRGSKEKKEGTNVKALRRKKGTG